jgi:hypothetical protein
MANVFSDNFNRSNEELGASANWTERAGDFEIVTNAAEMISRSAGEIDVGYYSTTVGTADYEVSSDLVNVTSITDWFGVCGRRVDYSTADSDMYTALANRDATNTFYTHKRVSGSWTQLSNPNVTLVDNAVFIDVMLK